MKSMLNSVPNTDLDPTNLVESFQTLFGINDVEMVMYIVIIAIFTFIYRETKVMFTTQKQKMNTDIELMLTRFCEILNFSLKTNKNNQHEIVILFDEVRRSYPFLDYSLYKKLDNIIISSKLSNKDKVDEIKGITEKQIEDLILIKNKNLKYSLTKTTPFIERMYEGVKDIIKPIILTIFILLTLYCLLISILTQTTYIEMVATPFSLIMGVWLTYFFFTLNPRKEFTFFSGILYICSTVLFFAWSLVDGAYFYVVFVLLVVSCVSFFIKKNIEGQLQLKRK